MDAVIRTNFCYCMVIAFLINQAIFVIINIIQRDNGKISLRPAQVCSGLTLSHACYCGAGALCTV